MKCHRQAELLRSERKEQPSTATTPLNNTPEGFCIFGLPLGSHSYFEVRGRRAAAVFRGVQVELSCLKAQPAGALATYRG